MAHEAEEYPAMNQSITDIRIVFLPTGQNVLTEVLRWPSGSDQGPSGSEAVGSKAVESSVGAVGRGPERGGSRNGEILQSL
jgi:hypothetical protein